MHEAIQGGGVKHLFRSPTKIAIMSVLVLGFAAILGFIAAQRYLNRASVPLDPPFYWIAGLSAFAVVLFCLRVLPMWLTLKRPVLTLSKDGITVTGKPPIAWNEIVENEWHRLSAAFITVGAALVIKTPSREVKCDVLTLECGQKTYYALCNMYSKPSLR